MKKNSSIKGLLFLLLLIAIVGSVMIYLFTRENMVVKVTVYDEAGPIENVSVELKNEKRKTTNDGSTDFSFFTKENDSLEVIVNYEGSAAKKWLHIDSLSYVTGYTYLDFLLDK